MNHAISHPTPSAQARPARRTRWRLTALAAALAIALGGAGAGARAQMMDEVDEFESLAPVQPGADELARLRAMVAATPPAGATREALLAFFQQQSTAAEKLGDYRTSLRVYRDWMASALPAGDKIYARWYLFNQLADGGDRADGMAIGEALLPDLVRVEERILLRAMLSLRYVDERDFKRAARLQDEAQRILQAEAGQVERRPRARFVLKRAETRLFEAKALLLMNQGRYAEAGADARHALDAAGAALEMSASLNEQARFKGQRNEIHALKTLMTVLLKAHRLYEVEPVAYRLIQKAHAYQLPAAVLSSAYIRIADLRIEQGRFADALKYAAKAGELASAAAVADDSAQALFIAHRKVSALIGMERWRAARQVQDGALAAPAGAALGGLNTLQRALIELFDGDPARAAELMRQADAGNRRQLGASHFLTAQSTGLHALTLHRLGRDAEARPLFAEALVNLRNPEGVGEHYEDGGLRKLYRRLILRGYLDLLTGAGADAALAEAYAVADYLRGSAVQQSVVDSAIRATASVAGLGDLVRKEQDGKNEIAALYDFLVRQLAEPAARQLPKVIEDMRARIARLDAERRASHGQIVRRFPAYDELIRPRAPTVAQTARRLGDGEVMLSILPAGGRTYVWAIRRDGALAFHAASLGEEQIGVLVRRLRATLDIGDAPPAAAPAFDAAAAHQLYAALLAPVAGALQGASHVIVSAAGDLAQIPFGVLLTSPAEAGAPPAWLIRRVAVSHVPSVSAWMALKQAAQTPAPRRLPFIGFGDPLFTPGAATPGVAAPDGASGGTKRHIALTRSAAGQELAPVSALQYAQLPPLPETRDEISAMARAMGADPVRDTFFGRAASRARVLGTPMADRQAIAFATHGLIAGDLPNLTQPALALAAADDAGDSPLLTLEDVLGLKLNADWVVLSACNTAAADGRGGEAISGLGRAFFYAGARALLVTHWAVESESAKDLTTATFRRFGADAALTRAQALRQAQLEVMARPGYAHPFYWAPYALIGDGGR